MTTTPLAVEDFDNLVAAALMTKFNGSLPPSVRAYEASAVPSPRPPEYVQVALARRSGAVPNLGGRRTTVGYRLTITAVSQHYIANVRRSLSTCAQAIEERRITVAGHESTPIELETQRAAGPDDGWFSGATQFVFVI